MTFVYVSGAGTGGKSMWAQVKGRTESALLELFPNAYMFRLAALQPMNGEVSKTWKTVWLLRHGVVAMLASFYLRIWIGWIIITRTKSAGFHLPCVVR